MILAITGDEAGSKNTTKILRLSHCSGSLKTPIPKKTEKSDNKVRVMRIAISYFLLQLCIKYICKNVKLLKK